MGVVKKAGASYSFGSVSLGRGYDAARAKLKEDKKLTHEILKAIKEASKATSQ